jgi:DNA-binding HxlR family transcriptional regulator
MSSYINVNNIVKHNKKLVRGDSTNLPKFEYCLTESGVDFVKIIKAIECWGLKWKFQNEECEKAICMYCDP